MAIKVRTGYSMLCDGCQKEYEADSWTVWLEQDQLLEMVTDSEWTTDGVRWHCWDCPPLCKCECCGWPALGMAGERDYMCPACWDASEEGEHDCPLEHAEPPGAIKV